MLLPNGITIEAKNIFSFLNVHAIEKILLPNKMKDYFKNKISFCRSDPDFMVY
jgi:hypothetical protein